jgi:sulfur relay (sulfurtransferase) complex TusBCD TusD component (DsrE family)
MVAITVVISEAPFGRLNALTGLRLAAQALAEGHKVNVFFIQDGVQVPLKKLPEGLREEKFNVREWLNKVIDGGAEIKICGFCADWRGMTDEDFIEKANIATMSDLVEWTTTSDKVITF